MKNLKLVLLLSFTFVSIGYARFPGITVQASASASDDEKAKLFVPDAARATIYIFRDNAFIGKNAKSKIVINNKAVAQNEVNHFVTISAEPGTYSLMSLTTGEKNALVALTHNKNKTSVELTAEAGQIYYFQEVFTPKGGFVVKPMSAEEAQPIIKKGKLLSIHKI
jgi:hypothetical protein